MIGVDDLVLMDQPSNDKIVDMLKTRYAADQIYTNIGPVLVAVNPFKAIPQNYTEARIREYRGKSYFELSPHIYALADDAYRNMTNYSENQSIIITGESGSGKTVRDFVVSSRF
jgi:myosin-1